MQNSTESNLQFTSVRQRLLDSDSDHLLLAAEVVSRTDHILNEPSEKHSTTDLYTPLLLTMFVGD